MNDAKDKLDNRDPEVMILSFVMALAQKLKISPKDFAEAAVKVPETDYLENFTIEYASATTKEMVQMIKDRKKK